MSAIPSGPTLTCTQCNFVNEAERVYCHNCGAKLDRSLIPKPEETAKHSLDQNRRRIKRMTNPGESVVTRELKALVKVLVSAAIVAAIILIVRAPENVPPEKPSELAGRIVANDLTDALEAPQPRALKFTEGEVNAHLSSSLKSKGTGMLLGWISSGPTLGSIRGMFISVCQQAVGGYPLYSGVRYQVGVKDGKFFTENRGGNFGRLAIHPALMKYLAVAFKPLFTALKREQDQIQAMQQVIPYKGGIYLVTSSRRQ